MRWIDLGLGPVPIEFAKLVDAIVSDPSLHNAIADLIAEKVSGAELDRGPRIPVISDFIENEMVRLEQTAADRPKPAPPTEELNELFRVCLNEVWHSERTA